MSDHSDQAQNQLHAVSASISALENERSRLQAELLAIDEVLNDAIARLTPFPLTGNRLDRIKRIAEMAVSSTKRGAS